MQFLYPIGFLALAGLTIPLLIHLWNVKQGKTLKIGSIALLGESSSISSKSFRINEWFLFFLRCLILILLAFLIAQPYLKKTTGKNAGNWILVDKAKFPQIFKENRRHIDSLLKSGYHLHDFNIGFADLSLKDTILNNTPVQSSLLSYTSLLNQLNNFVPAGSEVYLYAADQLRNFDFELPAVNYNLNWTTTGQADTLSSWILNYAGKKYEANSSPSATTYQALKTDDPPPIKIAIHTSAGSADSKYLVAALNAISTFSNRRIEINPSIGKVNIGFWLSEERVSPGFKSVIEDNGKLFQYETGKVISGQSFMNIEGKNIELSKRVASNNQAKKIWMDSYGNAVLSYEKVDNLNVIHFYSRFNPQWNQLVWNDVFVKALMPIIIRLENAADFGFENNPADQRRLPASQKKFSQINGTSSFIETTGHDPLKITFWLFALGIFIMERILSFRRKNNAHAKN